MRQSRRLALILAAQMCGIPLVSWAQTPPAAPATGGGASNSDDEEEDEEEPAAPSTTTPSESSAPAATETPSGTPEAEETPDARRTRLLPRFSSLDGSIGLLHTSSAMLGGAGSFRFGLIGEYFGASEFLRPAGLPGTMVTSTDSASHVGGTLTLSYSPLDFLEVFASIRAYANSNNRERPSLFQVLGDTTIGVKAAARVRRGIYVGGDASVYLLNRSGDIGLLLDSTSFNLRVLGSLDLKEITGNVPIRLHLNLQYYFDNSASIVSDTESRRRAAQPGYDAAACAAGTSVDPRCYLEVSRVERYALGINRMDHFGINIGAEATLPWVHPFVEWSVGIPVNRQSYQCYEPVMGTGPGGATDDDGCFANAGFSSIPSRVSLGARVLPPVRGLSATLAFDIATSGTSNFVRELSPTNPWQVYLGAAFAYDTHPEVQRVEVPGPERIVNRDVDRTPPGGHVIGNVRDAEGHSGVGGAILTFTGHTELPVLASATDGRFRSGHLPPGQYRVAITAPDYQPGECTFTIPEPAAPAPADTTAAGASATPPPPAPPAEVTANCEVRPLPRRGGIAVHVVSSVGGAGVANANVVITPAPGSTGTGGQAPTERTVTTDDQGRATANDLVAGQYMVHVESSDRHMPSTAQTTAVIARQTGNLDITVTRRPVRASATIRGNLLIVARPIHFEVNQATILPDSNTLLEEIGDVLNRHPEISAVEIQGHTDNAGQPATNMTLSENRANAVRDRLIQLGVAADRLTARGFGQTHPIRPNLTAIGRAANRRVEFHLTRTPGAAPTPAAPTTPAAH